MSEETVAALAGVVLGGLITGGVTFLMQWRRERRDANAARRVVESELTEAARAVSDALDGGGWPPGWDRWGKRWSESWAMYRPVLAVGMPDDAFEKVAGAYLYMGLLENGLAAGPRELSTSDETFLRDVSSHVDAAKRMMATGRRPWWVAG